MPDSADEQKEGEGDARYPKRYPPPGPKPLQPALKLGFADFQTREASTFTEGAESVNSGRKTGAEMARLYNVSAPTVSRIVSAHRTGLAGTSHPVR
jgi:hypothetical protein